MLLRHGGTAACKVVRKEADVIAAVSGAGVVGERIGEGR